MIAGCWSNRLPLAEVDRGNGDGGLVEVLLPPYKHRREAGVRRALLEETGNEGGRKAEVCSSLDM